MVTRVKPVKNNPSEGYEEDFNDNTDYLDVRGLAIQNDTSNDATVLVSRDVSNNLTLTDPIAGTYTLAALSAGGSGISASTHRTLRQLIHFIDEGPAEGFASGAYKVTSYTSGILVSSEIWYEDNTLAKKIVELTVTYSGIIPSTEEWKMYDTDGVTVLSTITDTYAYTGIKEINRTRTIV